MTNNEKIEEFAQQVFSQQSFLYKTLDDAKKTLVYNGKEYCFDALSLHKYYSTLDCNTEELLGQEIFHLCRERLTGEERKKLNEYSSLFHFLAEPRCQYHTFDITKEEQPDFVLHGNISVGVEVVSFTTETDSVLYSITNENFHQGKSAQEIKDAAIKKHGSKAEFYSYSNVGRTTAIGSPIFDCHKKREIYAETIAKKFRKYNIIKSRYDIFILLCDAKLEISIYDSEDSNEIISKFIEKCPEISAFNTCILRNGREGTVCDHYKL